MLIQRSSKKLKNIANKWNRFSPRASPSPQLAKRLLRNAQRFVWKDLGPLPAYLRAPKIYGHIMGLIMNLRTLALSSTVTEIVILVVASHFGAAYPLYAHEYQARAITDLTEAQVEAQGLAAYERAIEQRSMGQCCKFFWNGWGSWVVILCWSLLCCVGVGEWHRYTSSRCKLENVRASGCDAGHIQEVDPSSIVIHFMRPALYTIVNPDNVHCFGSTKTSDDVEASRLDVTGIETTPSREAWTGYAWTKWWSLGRWPITELDNFVVTV